MNDQVKKFARTMLYLFFRNRYIRMLFAYHLYQRCIAHSETIIALQRKEEKLDESYWMGKLRYYAHVVDKGLHRGDFSKGRGTRAYGVAKDALSHIKSREGLRDPSTEWAARKIKQYEEFQSRQSSGLVTEYVRTTCTYEDLLNAIKTRRSIRQYVDKPVEDEVIDKIASVLDWSPTSCNRQPARVYATNNPDIVRKCVTLHRGAACFTDIYAPLFLMFCTDSRLYEMPAEMALPHVDVALGVQNCVLVAHSLGISLTLLTCATLGVREEQNLREILGIPQHFQIVTSAVGGYVTGGAEVPARKNKELFIVR
jgi:nitroreductase